MVTDKTYIKQIEDKLSSNKVTLSLDERMRLLANLMIDKIIDDYQKGQLKFCSDNDILIMEHSKKQIK